LIETLYIFSFFKTPAYMQPTRLILPYQCTFNMRICSICFIDDASLNYHQSIIKHDIKLILMSDHVEERRIVSCPAVFCHTLEPSYSNVRRVRAMAVRKSFIVFRQRSWKTIGPRRGGNLTERTTERSVIR